MARESGSYKEQYIADILSADAALDTFFTAMDGRFTTLHGAAPKWATAYITMNAYCEDGSGNFYTHKLAVNVDTGEDSAVAGDALIALTTIVTALATCLTSIEGASKYTTVRTVEVTAICTMNN